MRMSPRTYLSQPLLHQLRFVTFGIVLVLAIVLAAGWLLGEVWGGWAFTALALAGLGVYDLLQRRHSVLRNYPILGRFRFLFESVRPELRQYFFESDTDGAPFNRLPSTSARRRNSTSGRSARSRMSTAPATNGSIIRSRPSRW
jgi:hypothetical protein